MGEPLARPDLVLIRHGQTEWSHLGRHTGRTDIPLTEYGEAQARSLGPGISGRRIARAFSSPLGRARRTAELAGLSALGDAFVLTPHLQEWDYGGYEGLLRREILQKQPGWDLWRDGVPPGNAEHPGESIDQVAARIDTVIAEVRAILAEDRGDVVAVAHGHCLRVLAARWLEQAPHLGGRFRLEPAHFSVLGFENEQTVIRQWNFAPPSEARTA